MSGFDTDRPMPSGFMLLIGAQFVSALADNALLILTIAALDALQFAPWWAPVLKWVFIAFYVVLAPFVGPLADAVPKARLMAWMNLIKFLGAALLLLGINPVLSYALVGLGAAAYAPAKYGLVTELVAPELLVRANAWIEVSVVSAALFGVVLGGVLVSAGLTQSVLATSLGQGLPTAGTALAHLGLPLVLLLGLYILAGLLNLGVPRSTAVYPRSGSHPVALCRAFWRDNRTLWRDRLGGLSLAVTALFWSVGACLQFLVLRWAQHALGLPLSQAAYLQAAIAVGVVIGACAASRWVTLQGARATLPMGLALGLMMPLLALCHSVWLAVPVLVVAGALGGWMVVPLNALLQHRGAAVLTAGRSIAVQGFNENSGVLLGLSLYAALVHLDVPAPALLWGFGLAISALLWLLMRWRPAAEAT
jgi:MFS family permease